MPPWDGGASHSLSPLRPRAPARARRGVEAPFFAAAPGDSPRIARLRKAPSAAAVAAFWDEMRRGGAPLVEPVAGEPDYSWLTFLWRATEPTTNVVVIDGVAAGVGGTEPRNSMLARLARTDVWYRTYKVRNDAAFTYTLSPNDSLAAAARPPPVAGRGPIR